MLEHSIRNGIMLKHIIQPQRAQNKLSNVLFIQS